MDKAFGNVIDGLSVKGSGGGDKKGGAVVFILVFVLVMLALISGVLTTAVIISRVAGTTPLPEAAEHLPAEESGESRRKSPGHACRCTWGSPVPDRISHLHEAWRGGIIAALAFSLFFELLP